MKLSITSNSKRVGAQVTAEGKKLSGNVQKALSITAQSGINIIQERTKKGLGYKDGKFKPYNKEYAAYRVKKGRGTLPNLEFERHMMSSITSRADSEKAVIFFRGAENSGKAAMNEKKRPFFGFSRQEERKLSKIFFRALK